MTALDVVVAAIFVVALFVGGDLCAALLAVACVFVLGLFTERGR